MVNNSFLFAATYFNLTSKNFAYFFNYLYSYVFYFAYRTIFNEVLNKHNNNNNTCMQIKRQLF
jgi:hypothetical protein